MLRGTILTSASFCTVCKSLVFACNVLTCGNGFRTRLYYLVHIYVCWSISLIFPDEHTLMSSLETFPRLLLSSLPSLGIEHTIPQHSLVGPPSMLMGAAV